MESFSQFSSDLDASTRKMLSNGQKMVELLKQKQHHTHPMHEQVILLFAAVNGYLERIQLKDIKTFEVEFILFMEQNHNEILQTISKEQKISDEISNGLHKIIASFIESRFKNI
jgi:F-type H+-transporting ATPase subunit alpha